MDIRLNKVMNTSLKVGDVVRARMTFNHYNLEQIEVGERALVESITDEWVVLYLLRKHKGLEEWNNRLIFERDSYDSLASYRGELMAYFEIIDEDSMTIQGWLLEKSLYDLERLVTGAREAVDRPDHLLYHMEALEDFLGGADMTPGTYTPRIVRHDILEQIDAFQRDRGYR